MRRTLTALSFSTAALLSASVTAQPLADRTPEDALLYIGWAGAEQMPAGYDGSLMQGLLEDAGLGPAIRNALHSITQGGFERFNEMQQGYDDYEEWHMEEMPMEAVPLEDIVALQPHGGEESETIILGMIETVLPAVINRPWSFYVSDLEFDENLHQPIVSAGLIINAGDQKDAIIDLVEPIIDEISREHPVALVEDGPILAIVFGEDADDTDLTPNDSLANAQHLADAAGTLPVADAAGMIYLNAQGMIETFTDLMEDAGEGQDIEQLEQLLDITGLDGVVSVAAVNHFENQMWATSTFVRTEGERTGLLALGDVDPVDESILRIVPAHTTGFMLTRFDPDAALELIREGVYEFDENMGMQLDDLLDGFAVETQVDLQTELLEPMGDQWLIYRDPLASLGIGPGLVLVNEPDDAATLASTLHNLAAYMQNALPPDLPIDIAFAVVKYNDINVNTLTTPVLNPAWALEDGKLFVGLTAQAVAGAVIHARTESSILDDASYLAARDQLPTTLSALQYMDLPELAPKGYVLWSNLLQSAAVTLGHDTSAPMETMLPPVAAIQPYLQPMVAGSWSTDEGFRSQAFEPFIAASLLGADPMEMSVPMALGTVLPALGAARRTARQMQANTQGRGIHQSLIVYVQSEPGELPCNPVVLLQNEFVTPDYLISPMYDWADTTGVEQMTEAEQTDWVAENCSYIIIPGLEEDLDWEKVAVVGRASHFHWDVIPVVFNDGHVEAMPFWEADNLVREQTDRSLDEWEQWFAEGGFAE